MRPLCFVLMPFGKKRDPAGRPDIDFDRVYEQAIKPAVEEAELECLRADEERTGGIIHSAMFERLLLSDFAVADLTTANANVFYELGVRHSVRPGTTVLLFAKHQPLPFDVQPLSALPYELGDDNAFGDAETAALRNMLVRELRSRREQAREVPLADSPLFKLLQGYPGVDLARVRSDSFRDRMRASDELRTALARARALGRAGGSEALKAIEARMGPLDANQAAAVVDLLLSYRAVEDFDAMVTLGERLPEVLRRTVLVREQLALAHNRLARSPARRAERDRAIEMLLQVVDERGPNSETLGLLGRAYKDQWDEARTAGDSLRAKGLLRKAIDAYARGFEADWRDAYPGINAVTLLEIEGSKESLLRRDRLVPVVRFAVEQRLRGAKPDYWDHATLLELAVLHGSRDDAGAMVEDALAANPEPFQLETTARNLGLIATTRRERGEEVSWIDSLVAALKVPSMGGPEQR